MKEKPVLFSLQDVHVHLILCNINMDAEGKEVFLGQGALCWEQQKAGQGEDNPENNNNSNNVHFI